MPPAAAPRGSQASLAGMLRIVGVLRFDHASQFWKVMGYAVTPCRSQGRVQAYQKNQPSHAQATTDSERQVCQFVQGQGCPR